MLGDWVWEALQASKALIANGDNLTLGQHVVLSQRKGTSRTSTFMFKINKLAVMVTILLVLLFRIFMSAESQTAYCRK